MPGKTKSRILWVRIAVAAFLSEALVVGVLIITTTVYQWLVAPGRTAAEYQAFADLAGYYVAPAAAGVATFLGALWVGRKLASDFLANGTLVGVAAVILTGGLIFVAKPEDRLMYGVSFVLRILGGCIGGAVTQRMSRRRAVAVQAWRNAGEEST
jgi:hypothetical protein